MTTRSIPVFRRAWSVVLSGWLAGAAALAQGPAGSPAGASEPEPGPGRDRPSPAGLLGGPGFQRLGPRGGNSPFLHVGDFEPPQPFVLERVESSYRTAPPAPPGSFRTGQEADLVLGWPGFEMKGDAPDLGNPSSLASDGKALVVADRWNNRVLYWREAPLSNTPPDRVFGQKDARRVDAGRRRDQMASPASVSLSKDGRILAVADSRNDRILVWRGIPDRDGAPADVEIDLPAITPRIPPDLPMWFPSGPSSPDGSPETRPSGPLPRFGPRAPLGWPWGVWTDGTRLVVVATRGASVLVWNAVPTADDVPPDLVLVPNDVRSPRSVTTDGRTWFALTDVVPGSIHNLRTVVWNSFPTNRHQLPDFELPGWRRGMFLADGGLAVGMEDAVEIWKRPPVKRRDAPSLRVESPAVRSFMAGDAVVASGRLYAASATRQQVVAWMDIPTASREPDFVLGGGSVARGAWAERFRIHDPMLATDGRSLLAASGRDRKIFLWLRLPDEEGVPPDRVLHLPDSPTDIAVHEGRLAVSTAQAVYFWKTLPVEGGEPEVLVRNLGTKEAPSEFTGVALDSEHLYLSDRSVGAIHVWKGPLKAGREPDLALILPDPGRLSSDGRYIFATSSRDEPPVYWKIRDLEANPDPDVFGFPRNLRLSSQALVAGGRLVVANRAANRVDIWTDVEEAFLARPASAMLGVSGDGDRSPLPARTGLVHPSSVAWAGGYLWVAESRFGSRILRFRPK